MTTGTTALSADPIPAHPEEQLFAGEPQWHVPETADRYDTKKKADGFTGSPRRCSDWSVLGADGGQCLQRRATALRGRAVPLLPLIGTNGSTRPDETVARSRNDDA